MTTNSPDVTIAVALGWVAFLVASVLVTARVASRGRFDLIDVFVAGLGAVYGAGYAFVIQATSQGGNVYTALRIADHAASFWVVPAIALVCIVVAVGCASAFVHVPAAQDPSIAPTDLSRAPRPGVIEAAAWGFLALSVVSSLLYVRAYGGIAGFFTVADALRSGLFDEAGVNAWSFLRPFGGFSIFATYLFGARLVAAPGGWRRPAMIGFAVSFVVASVTLTGWGGRVDLLMFWVTIAAGLLIHRTGVSPRLLGAIGAIAAAALLAMPALTEAMNPGKAAESVSAFYAKELSFPVESSLNSLHLETHRLGLDIAVAPLYLLPERIWGQPLLGIQSVSDRNSERMHGDVMRQGFGFTIPSDFITLGLHQFGLVGPLVLTVAWCMVLGRLDAFLVLRLPRPLSSFLYAHAAFVIAGLTTLYADPRHVVSRNLHFIVGLLALLLAARLSAVRPVAPHPAPASSDGAPSA
jgi:hypothetical protein